MHGSQNDEEKKRSCTERRRRTALLAVAAVFRVVERLAVFPVKAVVHVVFSTHLGEVDQVVVGEGFFSTDRGKHRDLGVEAAVRGDSGIDLPVIGTPK